MAKNDAKKAMKLHHSKGITLKQAWKEVTGGKRKPKAKKSKTDAKKARAKAKKAMKLHHSKGITLKQAWKQVNKFGAPGLTFDSDCPEGFESNPNIFGRRCIKKCPSGKTRDPNTQKCRNDRTTVLPGYEINPETGRQRKICQPGQTRDPRTKKCRNDRMNVLPGYEINPETGRQRKICQPGQYRDPVTKRCKKIRTNRPATEDFRDILPEIPRPTMLTEDGSRPMTNEELDEEFERLVSNFGIYKKGIPKKI